LARNIKKKLGINDYNFVHLTLILLLHYLVKCRSRSLTIYNNEFILDSACVGSEMHYITLHYITACARNVLQHERKWWTLTPLANSTFSNVHVTQSGSLAVDASFQFVDVRF